MDHLTSAFAFHARLVHMQSPRECAMLFQTAIDRFGFDTFACGEVDLCDRDRSVFYLIGWPESWRRFYIGSGLIEHDPIVESLATRREPYTWSDLRADRSFSRLGSETLKMAADHGWSEGLVVPLSRASSRVGLVSLAGHGANLSTDARAYLCTISIFLHQHVRSLVSEAGFAMPPMGLTEREIACLRLVARGLTDASIGEQLGVSQSTAHEFVEKAKHRLKVRSRGELMALATALGIIAP